MCCRDVTQVLTEEAEGALRGDTAARLAEHLEKCAPCREYRAQLATTVAILRGLPREDAQPHEVDAIVELLARSK